MKMTMKRYRIEKKVPPPKKKVSLDIYPLVKLIKVGWSIKENFNGKDKDARRIASRFYAAIKQQAKRKLFPDSWRFTVGTDMKKKVIRLWRVK